MGSQFQVFTGSELRKLALQRCELELLRSHPKDERGSVREIGLCVWIEPTVHFSKLSLMGWRFLHCCQKWSFSGRLGSPEIVSFGDPKWSHLGTENKLIRGPKIDSCWNRIGDRKLIDFGIEMNSFLDDQTR